MIRLVRLFKTLLLFSTLSLSFPLAEISGISALAIGVFIYNSDSAKSFDGTADNVRVRIEVKTPDDNESTGEPTREVFVSGDIQLLGAWRPDGLRLLRADGSTFYAEFNVPAGKRVQFKVTRGSWQTVEKDKFGRDIPNREFVAKASDDGVPQKVSIVVDRWGAAKSYKSTIKGTVKLHQDFSSQYLSRARNVSVWLPPDYDKSEQKYPVLYLQDGQNLFDVLTAAFGEEWRVDEAALELFERREIPPIIIVGIWNTADRMDEYTLTKDERLGRGGRGLDYIRFMTEELKPFIDRSYRTQVERDSTFIGGSSLGGLIAMHACLQKPDMFGCCLAFSPTLGWDQERLLNSLKNESKWPAEVRLWFSMGTREGRDAESQKSSIARAKRLYQLLEETLTSKPMLIEFREFTDSTHDEKSWAIQFPVALKSVMTR